MKKKYGKFELIKEQSHGESDIASQKYCLDFKLFVDKTLMESISLHSNQYFIDKSMLLIGGSKKEGDGVGYDLIKILRNYKFEDILRISNTSKNDLKNYYERSLSSLIEILETDKNILFYLPYNLFFKNESICEDNIKSILQCIYSDIKCILQYREKIIKKDTYISFVSQGKMVIAEYANKKLRLYDVVDLKCSKTYQKILDFITL